MIVSRSHISKWVFYAPFCTSSGAAVLGPGDRGLRRGDADACC
jgi:hypothetical protein